MHQPPELLELYRAGLKSAADLMKTSLGSAERLQNQQLAAIRRALEQQAKSVDELSQRMVGYWSSLKEGSAQGRR